jgi:DNA polymerase III sliding clamp (beta) subunit (PCNA family)
MGQFSVQGKKLVNGIKKTIYLNQPIQLSISGLRITFKSADGYRLVEYSGSLTENLFEEEKVFFISPQSAEEIVERADKEEKVIVTVSDEFLTFIGKKYMLTVGLLKDKPISYKIPANFSLEAELEKEKFLGALDMLVKEKPYRNEYGEYARVRLVPFDDVLLLSVMSKESPFFDDDKTRTFVVKMKTKYDFISNEEFFNYLEVFFNDKFLRDVVGLISSDKISLKFMNEYVPLVIISAGDNARNYLVAVMPLSPVKDAEKQLRLEEYV